MMLLHVRIEAGPGMRDELLVGAQEVARHSRDEPGCLGYHFYEDTEQLGTFAFFEQYVDQAAFDAHRREPYFNAWKERMGELIASRVAHVHHVERSQTL